MSIISAGVTTTTSLVQTGNIDGTLQLQVNGTTPSVTLATTGAVGVGSTPSYGTAGQVLTSQGSGAAPTWSTGGSSQWVTSGSNIYYNTGNVGIGATPSAWLGSIFANVLEGAQGAFWAPYVGGPDLYTGVNAYYDGSWRYKVSANLATHYRQTAGIHSWHTAPSGTAGNAISWTQAMTLNANGALALQGGTTTANGVGITFPATQSASSDANTLDDYEEGTFTPVLGDSLGGVATMSVQEGKYVKIGKTVQFSLQVVWTAKNTWTSTNCRISGLPFSATSNSGAYYWPNPAAMNCNLTTTAFNYAIEANSTQGYIMSLLIGQIDSSNFPSSGRAIINGIYQTP